ncbi:MAG TPA: response regulator [Sphingomicrobium sp.]|nr:response regulator [Sphingomicrobium sp.]
MTGGRILIVDDDERNLLALSEVLKPIADVATAASGKDALRLLLKEEFAVILLDVFMPGMDGYETAALIREREQTARIPIIFLSAVNKETEHLMRGYSMGAVDYVFKPVEPTVLRSKVAVFVDLYDMRRQVEEKGRAERELREAHYREQLSRVEAERMLQQSEIRQAALLDLLPLAIYEMGPAKGLAQRQFVGGDLTHFLGPEAAAVLAGERSFEDWVHPDDAALVESHLTESGDSTTVEYRWVGPDGSLRHLLDQRVAIDEEGSARRWAGTLLDISERKRLEAQLVHVGKLDALGQLTGGVAHDFNNLLSAVLGGLHLLQRRVKLEEREQSIVDQMQHAAAQGAELVRRMMAFARQQDLIPASVHPASLCDSVAGLVSHTLGGNVVVDWQCPDESLNLFVDRSQLELALMNLILNARDAMPDGGTIKVAINKVDTGLRGQPALRVRVADTGNGIPSDLVDRVTEPFFTTKEVGKGTGLGLSMVAGFVHQSGGEMSIASESGRGTTVDIVLPATEGSADRVSRTEDAEEPSLEGSRLLLIDDDESVRLVLAEQLRDAGAEVEEFPSGSSAVEAMRANPDRFRYIVCDFAMPGLDGLQTLRQLREISDGSRAILMTGHADDKRISRDVEFPVVRKPATIKSIVATLLAA